MDKEEKKQVGVSLFSQSEYLAGSDPIEEMFALNLGDFISEELISEDFAKKISISANKKERLQNQLNELIDIYFMRARFFNWRRTSYLYINCKINCSNA